MTTRYITHMSNDTVKSIVEELAARGKVGGLTLNGDILFELEAEDLWDAATQINELQGELHGVGLLSDFTFSKPYEYPDDLREEK